VGYYRPHPRSRVNLLLALIAGSIVLAVAALFGR
jgi:hypothetical protein